MCTIVTLNPTLAEVVTADHAAPALARGRGEDEVDGRADTQEDLLQEFIGEVVDAGLAAAIIPSHGCRFASKNVWKEIAFWCTV